MSKISIVGVQGSGKTVLMAALGAKYKQPDEYGLFLSPESPEAFGFVRNEMAKMRAGEKHGDWPGTTTPDSMCMLRWSLRRKTEDGDTKLCDLEFLDFGGEIYKRAFGSGTLQESKDAAEDWTEEIAALKKHIEESDVLLVLVNLRDVISGVVNKETNARLYATKGVLDYATRELKIKRIAMAFTQVDAYRKVIDESGRLSDVLQTHFPDVANVYSSLPLFAVSAVDKTFTGDDGRAYPAKDFGSQGLDDVIHWIVAGSGAWPEDPFNEEKRHLQSLWDGICTRCDKLEEDYRASDGMNSADRQRLVDETVSLIEELANHPKRNKSIGFSQAKFDGYRQRVIKWGKFEGKVGALLDAERAEKKELAEELWQELSAAELPEGFSLSRVQAEAERIRIEIAARRRNIIIGLIIAGVVVIAGLVAVLVNNAKVDKLCADGYSCESNFGIKKAFWEPGKRHGVVTYLKRAEKPGTWESTRPGRKWVPGTLEDRWQDNLTYPGRDDLISKKEEGCWHCTRDGWECEEQGGTNLVWQKGVRHSKCKWLVASSNKEGEWESTAHGWVWDGRDGVKWCGGIRYRDLISVKGSPDIWESTRDGYVWAGQGSFDVRWSTNWVSKAGNRRTTTTEGVFEKLTKCKNCSKGVVKVKCTCLNGQRKVWKKCSCVVNNGMMPCETCDKYGTIECKICSTMKDVYGNVWNNAQMCKCMSRPRQQHYVATSELVRTLQFSSVCTNCFGAGVITCTSCGGRSRRPCNVCGGKKWCPCTKCDSDHEILVTEKCVDCVNGYRTQKCKDCDNGFCWERE